MSVSGVRSSCDMLVKKCMIVDYIELFVDDIEALVVGAGPNVAVLVDSHRYHAQEVAELFLDFQFRHLAVGRVYRAADYQIVVVAYPEPTEGVEYHLLYEVVRERLECARRGAVEVSHLVRPGVEYAQAVASGAEPQVAVGVGHHAGHEVVAQGLYEFAVGVEKARGIGHHGLATVECRNPYVLVAVDEYLVDFGRLEVFEIDIVVLVAYLSRVVAVSEYALVARCHQVR